MWKSLVIPNDLTACQSLLAELARRVEEQTQRVEELQRENAEQKLTISELLRRAFEKRSERYLEHPDQLRLDFGNTAEAASAAESLDNLKNRSHNPWQSMLWRTYDLLKFMGFAGHNYECHRDQGLTEAMKSLLVELYPAKSRFELTASTEGS
jgi:hypothetical protein